MNLVIAGSRTVSPTVEDIDAALIPFLHAVGLALCKDRGFRDAIDEVISGAAKDGADPAGEAWATTRGIPLVRDPVTDEDYATHGRYLAPKMRNRRMAERGTHALIFWDGTSGGSADMCTRMVARGKPVVVVPTKPRARARRANQRPR